jgi:hypothetical protein
MTRRGRARPTAKLTGSPAKTRRVPPSTERPPRREGPISPEALTFAQRLLEAANLGDRHGFDSLPESEQAYFLRILQELAATGHSAAATLLWELDYDRLPVSLETFLGDPDYLGEIGHQLYTPWRRELATVLDPRSSITEWIITGAIGTGKTTAAVIAILYKLYRLTCLRDPQAYYGLLPGSPIVFGLFNLTLELAQSVSYRKLLTVFRSAPYFERLAPRRAPRLAGRIDLPKNLVCAFGSSVVHALGRDMIGGILSEVNFTRATEAHQVVDLYTGIRRRLESRFLRPDATLPNPGLLIVESSRRAQSDWLETQTKEQAANPAVHVTSFALWEVKAFPGPRFTIRVGDRTRPSTILPMDEAIPPGLPPGQVVHVPERLRAHFERDLEGALRDVAGVATYAEAPLIRDPSQVEACIDPHRDHPFATESVCLSIDDPSALRHFLRDDVFFADRPGQLRLHPAAPRYIHVDPALSEDCAALAMCHVYGSKGSSVRYPDGTLANAETPMVIVDFVLRIVPPRHGQIDLNKIREGILMLRGAGVHIAQVSYDRFQSADSIQILTKAGIDAKHVSVDTTSDAYFALRDAIFERRISYYRYQPFIDEITAVHFDPISKKVDHRPGGSKDCADAVAGAVFAAITDSKARSPLPPLGSAVARMSPLESPAWILSDYRDADLITSVNVR